MASKSWRTYPAFGAGMGYVAVALLTWALCACLTRGWQ